jgi:hypothetical protein
LTRKKIAEEDTLFIKYRDFLEKLYDESRLYRDLVYLSKFARMILYVFLGVSILADIFFQGPIGSFENLIYWLTRTSVGKIVALFFAMSLIIYGIERPRK